MLDVPELAETRLEFDYTKIPVNPTDVTSVNFRLFNLGNSDLGYDLCLRIATGWYSGFDDLSAQGGANSASTGLMLEDGQINLAISFTPPSHDTCRCRNDCNFTSCLLHKVMKPE